MNNIVSELENRPELFEKVKSFKRKVHTGKTTWRTSILYSLELTDGTEVKLPIMLSREFVEELNSQSWVSDDYKAFIERKEKVLYRELRLKNILNKINK